MREGIARYDKPGTASTFMIPKILGFAGRIVPKINKFIPRFLSRLRVRALQVNRRPTIIKLAAVPLTTIRTGDPHGRAPCFIFSKILECIIGHAPLVQIVLRAFALFINDPTSGPKTIQLKPGCVLVISIRRHQMRKNVA